MEEMAHEPFLAWDGMEYRDVQDEHGVDLAGLEDNLRLTPLERLERHARAARSVLWLQNAVRNSARHRQAS